LNILQVPKSMKKDEKRKMKNHTVNKLKNEKSFKKLATTTLEFFG
jgi:hypothetical protein